MGRTSSQLAAAKARQAANTSKKATVAVKGGTSAAPAVATSGSDGGSKVGSQLKAVQKSLEKAMKPSSEETAAEQTLGNLNASKDMGLNKIKAEPMAMPFVTGQSRELERATEEKALPLKVQLGALQARRQASINVANSQKGFLTDQLNRSATASKTALSDELTRARIAKLKAPKAGSNKSDWVNTGLDKTAMGTIKGTIQTNSKTGEVRRVPLKN